MKKSGTVGGNRLRALREYVGRTQLEVELEANLGLGYLQRVESGKVQRPERETIERILFSLFVDPVNMTERRSRSFSRFGEPRMICAGLPLINILKR